jgi:hypothetical protein
VLERMMFNVESGKTIYPENAIKKLNEKMPLQKRKKCANF